MKRVHNAMRWAVLVLVALAMNFPLLSTFATSLKSNAEITSNPGLWVHAPTLENYASILLVSDRLNIYAYLWNSLVASLIGAILPMILCFPIAWVIARRGYGRALFFPLVVNLRALPLVVFAIPIYMMFRAVGLLDTRLGLGLILAVVNLPLALMILVNAINDLPLEMEEAARMDGSRLGRILWSIVLPLCRPALITTFIFGFITAWNEFLFGLMLTTSAAVPMNVGASFFFASSGGGVKWGVAAAVIVVAALPPLLLGLVMYRRIGGSILAGAVKG